MKWVVLFVFVIALTANAMEVDVTNSIHFGTIQSGEIIYVSPELKNNTKHTIQLLEAWTSCPCFQLLDVPKLCEAGQSVFFPVRIDTAKRVGATTQKCAPCNA